MQFLKQDPIDELKHIVKCFWMIDSGNDSTVHLEKIIPDGYPEMIFHYKDPYYINIRGQWEEQGGYLIAGQIKNHFHLKNSGHSGIFAIKFQPNAISKHFSIDMGELVDKVIPLDAVLQHILNPVITIAISDKSFDVKVALIEHWLISFLIERNPLAANSEKALIHIIENNGQINIEDFAKNHDISKRTLERYFKKHVGLSPKLYVRIIRFSYIFKLMQTEQFDWSDISFLAGYYDQSHFIKNFKEFTGESPSFYGFDDHSMANFFLKK